MLTFEFRYILAAALTLINKTAKTAVYYVIRCLHAGVQEGDQSPR